MTQLHHQMPIKCVTSDGEGASYFSARTYDLSGDQERMLSEQIPALNFRLRQSGASYASGFHVAGDPTLLIMLKGRLKIELRNGEACEFSAGEMFIAEDYLAAGVVFDELVHGHRAEVLGGDEISVLHLKLEKRL
ncbi:MAG: hypothetical protein COA42_15375 [Alteromonadaceae bacterium]|nr:MAG: hypothetical protein COA42_15375 [Alteromonadaceae bacterium]